MKSFKEILQKSKETKEILSIYFYGDDDSSFWAGYIEDYNDELISIRHFTKYGIPDGIIVKEIAGLKRIDFDDDYPKALQYIIENSAELHKEEPFKMPLTKDENWQIEILKQVVGTENMVRLEIEDDYPCGFITKLSDEDVTIHWIGEKGEDYGKSVFKIEDITTIRVNDIDIRKRKMLFQWRKNNLKK